MELFTENFTKITNIENFNNLDEIKYLTKVYGDLIYVEYPTVNFINVHRENGHYILSTGIFCDLFPEKTKIGSIVPVSLAYPTEINYTGGYSEVGKLLTTQGYFLYDLKNIDGFKNKITNLEFNPITDYHDSILEGKNTQSDVNSDNINFYYPKGYVENTDTYKFPCYELYLQNLLDSLKNKFKNNFLLINSPKKSFVHMMGLGNSMMRHSDSNTSGEDNFLMTSITWLCDEEFLSTKNSGRELILGKRTKTDLMRYLNTCDNYGKYGDEPIDYIDLDKIKPYDYKTIVINSFNPFFYHGVEETTKGKVYSIITEYRSNYISGL